MTQFLKGLMKRLIYIAFVVVVFSVDASAWDIAVRPVLKAGYKHIALNINMPSPSREALIDVYVRDANVLCGSLGAEAKSGRLFGALTVEGNAARDIDVITPENYQWSARPLPFKWPGTGFATWDVDTMIGWLFNQSWGAIAGLRYDHLTVALGTPTDGAGNILIPAGIEATLGGNLTTRTWAPYIGLRLAEQQYSAILLYTPLASTMATISQTGGGPTGPGTYELHAWDWDITGTGSFAEAAMSYTAFSASNVTCALWGKGTWMKLTGKGQWNGLVRGTTGPNPNSDADAGLVSRYELAVGLSADLAF